MNNIREFLYYCTYWTTVRAHWPTDCLNRQKPFVGKDLQDQVLDDMDLERERGITIKSHAIQNAIFPMRGKNMS